MAIANALDCNICYNSSTKLKTKTKLYILYPMKFIKRKSVKPKIIIVGLVVLVLVCVGIVLERTGVINLVNRGAPTEETSKTTSTIPSAQEEYSDSTTEENKDPSISDGSRGSAEITDNSGAPSSDASNPITSASGEITLYLPEANSLISSGQEISGKSTLPKVHYRIIDDVSGVIATGQLSVVGGNFSGNIKLSTTATEGRLDIFATRSDGTEYSNIEVPIRLK